MKYLFALNIILKVDIYYRFDLSGLIYIYDSGLQIQLTDDGVWAGPILKEDYKTSIRIKLIKQGDKALVWDHNYKQTLNNDICSLINCHVDLQFVYLKFD